MPLSVTGRTGGGQVSRAFGTGARASPPSWSPAPNRPIGGLVMTEYSLAQLRELRRLALELGFMDDVAHWGRLIQQSSQGHTDGGPDA